MGLLRSYDVLFRYALSGGNYVRCIGGGRIDIHKAASLRKCKIYVYPGASLVIDEGCRLENVTISIMRGCCHLGKNCIAEGGNIIIEDGTMVVAHHAKLATRRIWLRFGGKLSVGEYTNINNGSEIRCDNNIKIGSYNQISYNVRIWDTNTHRLLPWEERRKLTREHYPYYGYEDSRPSSLPVSIGDDCWIGENCAILKGSTIGDRCVVGFGTYVIGERIGNDNTVVNERKIKLL